ncbi:hypothetical protein GCM10027347_11370 [Larkinella harenae]
MNNQSPSTAYYQEVRPQEPVGLNALEVAKWGFIELVVIVIVASLFKLYRQKSSRSTL